MSTAQREARRAQAAREATQEELREDAKRRRRESTAEAMGLSPNKAIETPEDEAALVSQVLKLRNFPYNCLGLVARETTREAVRKRYLQLALRLHPDKCSHSQASLAFAAVERAYKASVARAR